jgi:hypothetical protein
MGNIFVNKSIITPRTDSQTIYVYQGKFKGEKWFYDIRQNDIKQRRMQHRDIWQGARNRMTVRMVALITMLSKIVTVLSVMLINDALQ